MGHRVSAGDEETAGWLIASSSHAHRRMDDDGKLHGGTGRGSGGSVAQGGRRPERVGLEWAGSWAGYEKSQENGNRVADAVWAEKRIGLQICFRILFQGFEFKKDSNTFKPNLN
jgi:hypothetical protein